MGDIWKWSRLRIDWKKNESIQIVVYTNGRKIIIR